MLYFLVSLWALKTLLTLPQATYYWQLKEYRWDRMKVFFTQQGGKKVFFSLADFFILLLFVLGLMAVFFRAEPALDLDLYASLFGVVLLAQILEQGHLILKKRWKRPRPTLKALLILTLSFLVEATLLALVWFFVSTEMSTMIASLMILTLFEHDINAGAVFLMNLVSNFQKRRLYQKAQKKRLSFPKLQVVGITGSYGKTSVKEYLSQILEKKYEVLKTEKNTNTEIGIAQTLLKNLESKHDIFVCEMGAYKMGEIRICASMARPKIGIFTGLNDQHVTLFGSIDNTFKAKWELFQSLPADGLAIVNGDSQELKKRLKPLRGQTISVAYDGSADVQIQDLNIQKDSFSFRYKEQTFKAPLVGGFQVMNVLLSIIAAEHLGMTLKEIREAVSTLKAPEKTMDLQEISHGYLIDESYNVNTDGLKAAINHLKNFPDHQKILFFPGILELGADSLDIHEQLGEFIGQHLEKAFFFDPHFSHRLEKGALAGGMTRQDIFRHTDPDVMIAELKELIDHSQKPVVVLFESRGAEKVMKWLKGSAK